MELLEILEQKDAQALRSYFNELEPVDFAQEIYDFGDEEIHTITSLLDNKDLASLIEYADHALRLRLVEQLDDDRLSEAFAKMPKDDIVSILETFTIGRRKAVINLMKSGDQQIITKLLQYPEESAGRIMTTAYLAVKSNLSVKEGLLKIRDIGPTTEIIETIYVVNEAGILLGYADLRNFLRAPSDAPVSSITEEIICSVSPETDQEEVARLVSHYDVTSIPVVSPKGQILGIITVDDIIDVIVDEHNEDMLQMAGVSSEESLDTTLWESIRMRLPWLLVNLLTAFMASATVRLFEGTISQVVALSAVMTIVTGMGGNAGSQTVSIVVRELSQNEISSSKEHKSLWKEIALGLINGASTGMVTAIIVGIMYQNFYLALIVLLAMIGNLIISGIFGLLVPIILKKLHADPAVSSSIFVTTATDVLGFFLFLGLANLFLPYLIS